jgi:RNA polymerase sigma-70 factor (ECF subfamily)
MAEADTALGQGASQFPPTAWSLLSRLRDPRDPRVRAYLDRMIGAYWRPVYKFIRIGWKRSNEDAKDLTQEFFTHLIEGDLLEKADPERGNFRRLLMASLRNFLSNEYRSASALKRGGGRPALSLDRAEESLGPADPQDPKAAFEAQWARDLLALALERLARRLKPAAAAAFKRFHLEEAPVKAIAAELRATEAQVGHYLQEARSALRQIVVDEIREYVTDEAEIARELDLLFEGWR